MDVDMGKAPGIKVVHLRLFLLRFRKDMPWLECVEKLVVPAQCLFALQLSLMMLQE